MYNGRLARHFEMLKHDLEDYVKEIDIRLPKYRKGSLVIQNDYAYIKHYENGKVISTYVGKHLTEDEIETLKRELQNRRSLENQKSDYVKEINELNKLINKYSAAYEKDDKRLRAKWLRQHSKK